MGKYANSDGIFDIKDWKAPTSKFFSICSVKSILRFLESKILISNIEMWKEYLIIKLNQYHGKSYFR